MRNFSLEIARPLIEEAHSGKLIYAGGDDLAAIVPVEDLLSILRGPHSSFSGIHPAENDDQLQKLQEEIGLTITGSGFAEVKSCHGKHPLRLAGPDFTVSAGVAICHHTHPFSHAVEEATKAMKEGAKERLGRDSFVICLYKRSGQPVEVGSKWIEKSWQAEVDVLHLIEQLKAMHVEGKLSARLPDLMAKSALALRDWPIDKILEDEELQAKTAELRRLLSRNMSVSPEQQKQLLDKFVVLLKQWDSEYRDSARVHKPNSSWERLIDLHRLARFLAQGE